MHEFLDALKNNPVIASARDMEAVARAANSTVSAVFLLGGSILNLREMTDCARRGGKYVFVHLDLLAGLGRDAQAVEWCAKEISPDGLISTRTPLLKRASELGLLTLQRLFVMDSSSIRHGINLFKGYAPDMLEVLPGLLPRAITELKESLGRPIIAGGMVTKPAEVAQALRAGASGVSTSEESLWRAGRFGV